MTTSFSIARIVTVARLSLLATAWLFVPASTAQAQARITTTATPAGATATTKDATKDTAKEIEWAELVPKNWDVAKLFRELKLDEIRGDADPRAVEAMAKMRKAFDEAPIEPSLNGKNIKIMGFLVPLDMTPQAIGEFLLVPFFGACIHTPPPPANQIIHVKPAEPMKGMRAMETVWVEGKLEAVSSTTSMGQAGYVLKNPTVSVYKRP
jgi:uncharacterized protein